MFFQETVMIRAKKITGFILATAAAGLFATADLGKIYAGSEGKIQCSGVNTCRGQSDCSTANNECKGHNSCMGESWLYMTEEECRAEGGKIEK